MTEPMSTPDSGGLREAVEALAATLDGAASDGSWLSEGETSEAHRVAHLLRVLLAAHPEPAPTTGLHDACHEHADVIADQRNSAIRHGRIPGPDDNHTSDGRCKYPAACDVEPVPTPDSERAVEAAARAIHNKQEYTTCWDDADAGSLSRMDTPRRALGEQGREFYRGLARVALGAVPMPDSADDATVGERLIRAERQRQIEAEGYTVDHDREHGGFALSQAAYCYKAHGLLPMGALPGQWPWDPESWKPRDPISNLIRSGALYLAAAEQGYFGANESARRCAALLDASAARLGAPATPPADDANRAPVSGGLDEGERKARANDYTPPMGRIRDEYVEMRRQHYGFADLYAAEFDRALAARDAAWVERLAAERDTARREAGERIAQAIEAEAGNYPRGRTSHTLDVAARIARADALTSDDGSGA